MRFCFVSLSGYLMISVGLAGIKLKGHCFFLPYSSLSFSLCHSFITMLVVWGWGQANELFVSLILPLYIGLFLIIIIIDVDARH